MIRLTTPARSDSLPQFFIFAVGDQLNYPELGSAATQLSWERGVQQGTQELTMGDEVSLRRFLLG